MRTKKIKLQTSYDINYLLNQLNNFLFMIVFKHFASSKTVSEHSDTLAV